ncbi:MAG: DUF5667 domain-containing protein [Bacillota bacterium]|nr:DUF5667 domain-containing protein [Bacillota bacterium]
MSKTRTMKTKLAAAVTVAFLALPLSTAVTLADTSTTSTTTTVPAADSSVPTTTAPATTSSDTTTTTTTPDTTSTTSTTPDTTSTSTTTSSDDTTPVVDSNGSEVTPASWLSDLIAKIKLALTFDPAKKAELYQHSALTDLAEAQKQVNDDETDKAEVALNKYTEKITSAQEFIDKVEDPNSVEAKDLEIALSKVHANNVKVLGRLLDKLPPQAAQKIALNIVRAMEKAVNKMEKEGTNTDPATTTNTTPTTDTTTTTPTTTATTTPTSTDTTTTTTPSTTVGMERKALQKQAKIALDDFKKCLNQGVKSYVEDQDQDENQDNDQGDNNNKDKHVATQPQSKPQSQPNNVTVTPVKPATTPSYTHQTEQHKEDTHKQVRSKNEKGRDGENDNRDE